MRDIVCGLIVFGVVACAASTAAARCGDQPGDLDAVISVVGAIVDSAAVAGRRPPYPGIAGSARSA